jgi:hypothetical protein
MVPAKVRLAVFPTVTTLVLVIGGGVDTGGGRGGVAVTVT